MVDTGPRDAGTQHIMLLEKIDNEKRGIDLESREGLRFTNELWTRKFFMIPVLNEFGSTLLQSGEGKCVV